MQTLFEWDFDSNDKKSVNIDDALKHNIDEFAPGMKDRSFIDGLIKGVIEKKDKIDSIIEKAAPDWPIDKIAPMDRNILRIGLYELLFGDREEVPPKVAINEAIELAKTYGGTTSGKFVNGVLGAVYKELGEPGKDDTGNKKKKETIDFSKLPVENLIGAVVYAKEDDETYLALIHDVFGRWTLTKGHLEEGESDKDGVKRKALDEMGAKVIGVKESLGENEYVANKPEIGKIKKHVSYYLAEAKFEDLKAGESGGIDDAKWFKLKDVVNLNMYDDILPIFTKAINILLAK